MRILVTTFTYPPNADGCAVAAAVLAEGLAARGHAVTVATTFHPARKSPTQDTAPRVEQFKISGTSNRRIGVQGDIAAYQTFLRQSDFALIIFENWDAWPTYLAEPLLPKLAAKKILVSHGYTPHLWHPQKKFPWGLGVWAGGWPLVLRTPFLMRRFDHLVFLSRQQDFNRFLDHRLAQFTGFKKFSIIPNGAFVDEFNDATLPDFRTENGISKQGVMVLCVANYSDRKNQMLAVRAFRRAQLKEATLVFIGSEFNDYSEKIRQLDAELQQKFPDGKVLLLEKQNRRQTCAAYRAADFFVLSAKAETQPIVLLESMAAQRPWISTDTGCVSELPGGLVVHSEDELVKQMGALSDSPELRQRLGREGWMACQKTYDWKQVVAAYDFLAREVCSKKIQN